jgi:hypothetical protein
MITRKDRNCVEQVNIYFVKDIILLSTQKGRSGKEEKEPRHCY